MRARTTLLATAVVAVALVAAVAALAAAVERTLAGRIRAQGEAAVDTVADALLTGAIPEQALAVAPGTGDAVPYVAILDREGRPVVGSGFFAMPGVEEVGVRERTGQAPVVTVGASDLAIAQRSVEVGGRVLLVVAASRLAEVVRSVGVIVRAAAVGVPLLVLLVGAVTWAATGRTLRPIERIRSEVEELSSRTLDRRVPVPDSGDEVARLAETMNRMLARLESASARQRAFVSDASHELRSPVAAIRAELEVALAHPVNGDWPQVAAGVLGETGRIEGIVEDLLLLARRDEGAGPEDTIVDLGLLVRAAAARRPEVPMDVGVADGLLVLGREGELASVVRNLLDNAARHARSRVAITAADGGGATVSLTVDDDGPGIPPDERIRVFERFTRLEADRSRAGGGVGLGLAVVDRVVRDHGGSVTVTEGLLGGARFEVVLPAAP